MKKAAHAAHGDLSPNSLNKYQGESTLPHINCPFCYFQLYIIAFFLASFPRAQKRINILLSRPPGQAGMAHFPLDGTRPQFFGGKCYLGVAGRQFFHNREVFLLIGLEVANGQAETVSQR